MKITLRPKGESDNSADVVLADGADRADDNVRGPAKSDISVSIAVQQTPGIGSESMRFKSRDNRSGFYSFTASRRFATLADAGRFILTHGSECPAEGTLIFDYGDGGNVALLIGACIRQIGPMQQTGTHIRTGYSVNYSSATSVAAAAVQDAIDGADPDVYIRRINCGSNTEADGWGADIGAVGGEQRYLPTAAVTGYGATPIAVYRYYRVVSYPSYFEYTVALLSGVYDVILHLCAHYDENYTVDIAFNTTNVRSGYDIKAQAGGVLKAKATSITHTHTGGNLVIRMTPNGAGRFGVLCGIEIRTQ